MTKYNDLSDQIDLLREQMGNAAEIYHAMMAENFNPHAPEFSNFDLPKNSSFSDITNANMEQPEQVAQAILSNAISRMKAANGYLQAIDDIIKSGDLTGYENIKMRVHRYGGAETALAAFADACRAKSIIKDRCYKNIPGETERELQGSFNEALYLAGTEEEYPYEVPHLESSQERFENLAVALNQYAEVVVNQIDIALYRAVTAGRNFIIMRTLQERGETINPQFERLIHSEAIDAFVDAERIVYGGTDIVQSCIDMAEAIRSKGSEFQILDVSAPVKSVRFDI